MNRLSFLPFLTVLPLAASAQSYSENFDADHTSAWSFNTSIPVATHTDGANDNYGGEANFFFDYSTIGIPSAPHSAGGTTFGLKMEANIVGTTQFSGLSVSPNGQSFSGDYTLTFDAWQNVLGPFPGGGSGSTQLLTAAVGAAQGGTAQGLAQFQGGNIDGAYFGASGDGGTNPDYRAYTAPGAVIANNTLLPDGVTPVYGAGVATGTGGSTDNTNAYYTSKFQGASPAAQTALYASQGTGTIAAGALGMAWHSWTIARVGSLVTWSVDGYRIATVSRDTFAGSDIALGLADINTGSSTDPNSRFLSFGLIDNVSVAPVPEPATFAALGLGALVLVRRRRK